VNKNRPAEVFISHVEEDGKVALEIKAALQQKGISAWCYEEDNDLGNRLDNVTKAISNCRVFLLLASDRVFESFEVHREIEAAYVSHKRIVPLRLNVTHADLEQRLPNSPVLIGTTVSLLIPPEGIAVIMPAVIRGLERLGVTIAPTPDDVREKSANNAIPVVDTRLLEWIFVPPGKFTIGSDLAAMKRLLDSFGMEYEDNLDKLVVPISQKFVPEFWITKHPITNEQYQQFVIEHPSSDESEHRPVPPYLARHPVVMVTWHEAFAFGAWMGCNLPTAEQWEKAARGDSDLRHYPWGDLFDAHKCACAEDECQGTSPVGSFPDGNSPYGLTDMTGNVMEWLRNRKDGDSAGAKGGAFDMTCKLYGLIHFTTWVELTYADSDHGFRIVSARDPKQLSARFNHSVSNQ